MIAQVAAPPSDDQEKETASSCIQRTSEAESEKQDEDTEDSDDEDDTEIPPGAVITCAPVLFQSPSGFEAGFDNEENSKRDISEEVQLQRTLLAWLIKVKLVRRNFHQKASGERLKRRKEDNWHSQRRV